MNMLTYEIRADAPLLMTRLQGDPNSSESYPYVPGSAIRGALANRYRPGGIVDLAKDDIARQLFFDGGIRYLNAYPLDRKGQRTLPTPFSWVCDKHTSLEDGTIIEDLSSDEANCPDDSKGVSEARPFCWLDGTAVELYAPDRHVSVHTARERTKGRATPDEGAVFRYEALAAGIRLGGIIVSPDKKKLETLRGLLLAGPLWLGGSRSGSYGRVQVIPAAEVAPWQETPAVQEALGPGDRLVLTLLSDALLRTAEGALVDTLLPGLLPAPIREAIRTDAFAAFKRVAPLGGFNRRWGLPIDQALAVQAGSVFVYDVVASIPAKALCSLQEEGVGERRLDGFGRVGVNLHDEHAELTVRKIEAELPGEEPITLSETSERLALRMAESWLRQDLDRLLADHIQELGHQLKDIPSRAQLSRLRVVTLNALPSRDIRRLLAFLFDANLKPTARNQYLAARVKGERLLDWLAVALLNALPLGECEALAAKLQRYEQLSRDQKQQAERQDADLKHYGNARINALSLASRLSDRIASPRSIWSRISQREIMPRELGKVKATPTDSLAREYTIRLIAGLLHRATKEVSE